MKEKIICCECGCVVTEETARHLRGTTYCEDCYSRHTVVCDSCGERIPREEAESDGRTTLCLRCYENFYVVCRNCGEFVSNDDSVYSEEIDGYYCEACYEEIRSRPIKSYSYKPEPIFYGSGNLFMGVELEIDNGGEYNDNARELLKVANADGQRMYIKHDGSLSEGMELVSHPMSLEYHRNDMKWQDIFNKALEMDYRSHQTNTCGLHIHVNRSAFGCRYEEIEAAIGRVIHFVELHWNELLRFSRRTEASINRWASRYGITPTVKETYDKAKNSNIGRYVAVNLENDDTIEFRMFRGTLRYSTFIATLQLVYEICRFAIMLTDKELESMSWSEFVSKIDPEKTELIEYLKAKRLYVNEITTETEEM